MTSESQETSVSNVETEYLEINSKSAWPILFQHVRNECSNFKYTYNEAKKIHNSKLNRYRDVAPYDHTRVELKRGECNYINANIVEVERAKRVYILTQGPLPYTAGHFWLMAWEQETKGIIMLNKVVEKHQVKCYQYWPTGEPNNEEMFFPDVNLKITFLSMKESSNYTITTLRLKDGETNNVREILHFHYTTWPDFGVPQSPTAFLRFLVDVRQHGVLSQSVGPPIVHCSAGIGRSGTFCLVDSCLVLIEQNGLNSVNVREVLLEMRKCRMGLIQTPDQLRFSYAAIIEGSKQLPSNNVNDDVVINYHNVVKNANNSSLSEEDEPPPLPPPRGESLMNRCAIVSVPCCTSENGNVNIPPNKPLPSEPSTPLNPISYCTDSSPILRDGNQNSRKASPIRESKIEGGEFPQINSTSNSNTKSQLRQRHPDKRKKLAAQVREMKRRQQETEKWQKLKRSLFSPLSIGIGAAIVGGSVLAICWYLYIRE